VRGTHSGGDLATGGAEFSVGENGLRLQAGATGAGVEGTLGTFDENDHNDTVFRGGLSAGPSLGVRGHWGDSDHDGRREWGAGVDIGPISVDFKTESKGLQGPVPWLVDHFTGDDGPSGLEQIQNQLEDSTIRDRQLEELEKNKEKIMKEQGPDAYYRNMLLANAPLEVRKAMGAAQ
jgi:hypothetical protein